MSTSTELILLLWIRKAAALTGSWPSGEPAVVEGPGDIGCEEGDDSDPADIGGEIVLEDGLWASVGEDDIGLVGVGLAMEEEGGGVVGGITMNIGGCVMVEEYLAAEASVIWALILEIATKTKQRLNESMTFVRDAMSLWCWGLEWREFLCAKSWEGEWCETDI